MANKNWFRGAVHNKPPYNLGGWKKTESEGSRRYHALASRPKSWSLGRRYLSTARALQSLANVTRDRETRKKALSDARYFYDKYNGVKK